MKILFLVYHGFSEVSGISKKIHYQVKGLRENGHDVRLDLQRMVIVADILMTRLSRIMARESGLAFVSALITTAFTTIVYVKVYSLCMPVVSRMLTLGSSVFLRDSRKRAFMPSLRFPLIHTIASSLVSHSRLV